MPCINSTSAKAGSYSHIRLGDYIRQDMETIIKEWSLFAKTKIPAGDDMTALALRDHIVEILTFLADDLETSQTNAEQVEKSQGEGPKEGGLHQSAAEIHAALRWTAGFDIDQMVSEYRALRASVVKLWSAKNQELKQADFNEMIRFNEAIDQAMTESISEYTKTIDRARNTFLGILSHDLITPVGAASTLAGIMIKGGGLDEKQFTLASQIVDSTTRARQIISYLLDLTRTGFGAELPIVREPMDMGVLAQELVNEMQACFADREITLVVTGNPQGQWDRARIGQIFSNLIGNAVEYSYPDTIVRVVIEGKPDKVAMSVYNKGTPIPLDKMKQMFDANIRGEQPNTVAAGSTHLGLGLYITKQIVASHGGEVAVASSEQDGTVFTVTLPLH